MTLPTPTLDDVATSLDRSVQDGDLTADGAVQAARHIDALRKRAEHFGATTSDEPRTAAEALARLDSSIAKTQATLDRLDDLPTMHDHARDALDRVIKHRDEDAVVAEVRKGVRSDTLDRADVSDAMTAVAKQRYPDADEVEALARWIEAGGPLVEAFSALHDEASEPEEVEASSGDVAKSDEVDEVTKRATEQYPDLDEVDAVAAYLDTPEGAEHYAAEHG